jgi:hypothetical protein
MKLARRSRAVAAVALLAHAAAPVAVAVGVAPMARAVVVQAEVVVRVVAEIVTD